MKNDDIKEILINTFHNKCEDCYLNGVCHLGEYEDDPKPCMESEGLVEVDEYEKS